MGKRVTPSAQPPADISVVMNISLTAQALGLLVAESWSQLDCLAPEFIATAALAGAAG